jgi:hypothetical protein
MTVMEVIVFVLLVYGVYRLISPARKKLETKLKEFEDEK